MLCRAMPQRIGDGFLGNTVQVVTHLASHRVEVAVHVKFAHQSVDFREIKAQLFHRVTKRTWPVINRRQAPGQISGDVSSSFNMSHQIVNCVFEWRSHISQKLEVCRLKHDAGQLRT